MLCHMLSLGRRGAVAQLECTLIAAANSSSQLISGLPEHVLEHVSPLVVASSRPMTVVVPCLFTVPCINLYSLGPVLSFLVSACINFGRFEGYTARCCCAIQASHSYRLLAR
ncbi:hypothetical protein TRVL_03106 [Trypanosoma vivax]|nr:hypothetical protein TRVL_03106 [Trypanosoma vivax]